ncbi:hypothetical protein pdam_00020014 [Pocillopora damicornis]|uniref:Uncharacterized protein n=1 Tax=Pocillopora damicornis TaxID=46731 RepID=A0A3M6UWA3_POCDA|nr:hypothetical protein pdam_00020014 [Pocillopora damicornis]
MRDACFQVQVVDSYEAIISLIFIFPSSVGTSSLSLSAYDSNKQDVTQRVKTPEYHIENSEKLSKEKCQVPHDWLFPFCELKIQVERFCPVLPWRRKNGTSTKEPEVREE